MSKVGDLVKNRRESLRLTVDEISTRTAIRPYIINIIEQGKFSELPSYVHAHGFLEQYSKVLGLDFAKDVKPLFDEECSKESFGKSKEEIEIEKDIKPISPKMPTQLKFIFITCAALLAVAVFSFINFSKKHRADNVFIEEPINIIIETTPSDVIETVLEHLNADEPEPKPAEPVLEPDSSLHTATLQFRDTCWVYLIVDGAEGVEFTAHPGDLKKIVFTESFKADFGNAHAAKVSYDEQVFDNFGPVDVIVRNNYFDFDNDGKLRYSRRR